MRIVRSTALLIFLICNVGCLSPLAINTVGSAGSAAPVASNNLGGGRGESFWIAQYDDVIEAVLQAGEVLSLEVKEKKNRAGSSIFSILRHESRKNRPIHRASHRYNDIHTVRCWMVRFGGLRPSHVSTNHLRAR